MADLQKIDDAQFGNGLENADIGEDGQTLVGHEFGAEGDQLDGEERGEDGDMENDQGGVETVRRDDHLVVEIPQARGLGQDDDEQADEEMGGQGGAEGLLQLLFIAFAQGEGDETRGRRGQGPVEEGEEADDAADGLVEPVVVDAQDLEDDPAGVQRHKQDDQHPGIEEQGVLGDGLSFSGLRHGD